MGCSRLLHGPCWGLFLCSLLWWSSCFLDLAALSFCFLPTLGGAHSLITPEMSYSFLMFSLNVDSWFWNYFYLEFWRHFPAEFWFPCCCWVVDAIHIFDPILWPGFLLSGSFYPWCSKMSWRCAFVLLLFGYFVCSSIWRLMPFSSGKISGIISLIILFSWFSLSFLSEILICQILDLLASSSSSLIRKKKSIVHFFAFLFYFLETLTAFSKTSIDFNLYYYIFYFEAFLFFNCFFLFHGP